MHQHGLYLLHHLLAYEITADPSAARLFEPGKPALLVRYHHFIAACWTHFALKLRSGPEDAEVVW